MPLPQKIGKEPDAFAPAAAGEMEGLASLVYVSGAQAGLGDNNAQVSSFIGTMNDSVYSQYMNAAQQKAVR